MTETDDPPRWASMSPAARKRDARRIILQSQDQSLKHLALAERHAKTLGVFVEKLIAMERDA